VDYGEYPARVGESSDFVTFATVKDEASGYPYSVMVRTFNLPQLYATEVDKETGRLS
jgi:hypothetical protein